MTLAITVTHEGGRKVDARIGEFVVRTDQSREGGGEGSAPEPYMLFLASLAACAGIYVVGFCEARSIPTGSIRIVQDHDFDEKTGRLLAVRMAVEVGPEFPAKYVQAIARVASMCAVKRTIDNPPEFTVETRITSQPSHP